MFEREPVVVGCSFFLFSPFRAMPWGGGGNRRGADFVSPPIQELKASVDGRNAALCKHGKPLFVGICGGFLGGAGFRPSTVWGRYAQTGQLALGSVPGRFGSGDSVGRCAGDITWAFERPLAKAGAR